MEKIERPWFSLDCNISDDPDIIEMELKLGDSSFSYYIKILGLMRLKSDLRLKYDIKLIARSIRAEKNIRILKSVIEDFGFFKFDEEGYFYSLELRRRVKKVNDLIDKRTKAINKRWHKTDSKQSQIGYKK